MDYTNRIISMTKEPKKDLNSIALAKNYLETAKEDITNGLTTLLETETSVDKKTLTVMKELLQIGKFYIPLTEYNPLD